MKALFRRLYYLLNRDRLDRELASDMEFHREMAEREGAGHLGNALLLREEAREAWGWMWIDRLMQDLRYAVRILRKSPGFTLAAVLMLALGIGVNVAAFGFLDLMILRPLPVRNPATIRQFLRSSPENFSDNLPYAAVEFYSRHVTTLSAVLAVNLGKVALEGDPKQLDTHFVTPNFFAELAAGASYGRLLDPARDGAANSEPVVVLGYTFWQHHFGGDPSIVGKSIRLNSKPATVIGVASPLFSGLGMGAPDLWAPINQQPYFVQGGGPLTDFSEKGASVLMWGRLGPGVTPKAAEQELQALAATLRTQHPNDVWQKESLPSRPGAYAATIHHEMYPLLGIAATLCLLILAVACGNLGSLLLARGVTRQREISIRMAVGAGRARVVRQLITESLTLALLGTLAGLLFGYVAMRVLLLQTGAPAWMNAAPDWRVIVFASAMGLASALFFGLTPALQAAWQRQRATFARRVLIGAQVAGSCVLLIVAGLLARALDHAAFAPPGFDFQHVITIDPRIYGYTPANARTYLDQLRGRLLAIPGVESVAMASNPPLGNRWTVSSAQVAGSTVNIHYNHVDAPFFQTMGIPLVRGHNLPPGDARAIVVSESLARLRWPAEDPIGKPFRAGDQTYTVAGVAGSARLVSPEDSDAVEIYQAAGEDLLPAVVVLVRTSAPPQGLLSVVSAVARSADPKLQPDIQLMEAAFRDKVQSAAYMALAATALGVVALLLACAGIIGLVAYAVSQHTREIGIRMALGARPAHVISAVLFQLFRPLAIGLMVGAGGAAALSQTMRGLLYGVSNLDPLAYIAALGLFAITAGLAAVIPARRALRIDPMRALRYD